MKKPKVNWCIHYVTNDTPCAICGEEREQYLPFICDAHTHGMDKYKHLEFQIVLALKPDLISEILNSLAFRVKNGERFKDGDYVNHILTGFPVQLKKVDDGNNHKILRVILPDPKGRFPEDFECEGYYALQQHPVSLLRKSISNT